MENPSSEITRWREIEALFHRALELPEDARPAQILEWCNGEESMAREVMDLLAADWWVVEKMHSTQAANFGEGLSRDVGDAETDKWTGRVLGSYQLQRVLGRGGMGVVYLAERVTATGTNARQEVAVKMVRRNLRNSPAVQHFLLERDALARLEHANIARLLDGGVTEEGLPYVVMEFVEGRRLDAVCDGQETTIEMVLGYMLQLCAAVTYVHRNLILHRDLKPGNVMVTTGGVVKLLDFGTLKLMGPEAVDSAMTQAGMRPVTLRYASPEHIQGGGVSTASDVYSLGVMLYRLVAGRLPEGLENLPVSEHQERLREGRIQPPSALATRPMGRRRGLARDLDAIVIKAMRFEPEARYATAELLAAELTRALEQRPVEARGDSRRYRVAKFYQRNWGTVWATAAMTVVLAMGLTAMAREAKVARLEKSRAEASIDQETKLAHLLLFDYFTQLQQIPGSTDAQRRAVTLAVQYLDGLTATAPSAAVKLETVRAYTAMGTLLGSPYYQNLGDAPGAIKTLLKALPLSEQLVHSDVANAAYQQARAGVQMALGQVYMGSGNAKLALEYLQPAAETNWKLANRQDADLKTVMAATTPLGLLGDDYSQRGNGTMRDPAKATEIYERVRSLNERGLQLDPACARCKRGLAVADTKLGQLTEGHDTDRAMVDYERGLAVLGTLSEADQAKTPVQRSFGSLRLALIGLYLHGGRKAEAEALLDEERARVGQTIAGDPMDARARFDLAAIDSTAMDAYFSIKDHEGALLSSGRFLDSTNILFRLQPKNETWKYLHANALLSHGKALMESGRREQGEVECSQGLQLVLPMAADADAEPDTLGTASQFLVYLHRDPAKDAPLAVSLAQRAMSGGGQDSSDQLLLLAEAQRFNHQVKESKGSAQAALKILEATPKGLGHGTDIVQARELIAQ
jgi:non-specific serine/threonine protein kinase/serine/threonine-protein kinase